MPLTLNLPAVPAAENNPRERIIQKYLNYKRYTMKTLNPDPTMIQGERYEIVAALKLWQGGLITHGNQIGRWTYLDPNAGVQDVMISDSQEYDFVLPDGNGSYYLGEAKSYTAVSEYVRKAAGFCMNQTTRNGPPAVVGFCFVTPQSPYSFYMKMLKTVHDMLTGRVNVPAMSGFKLDATSPIRQYFRQHYMDVTQKNYVKVYQDDFASDHIASRNISRQARNPGAPAHAPMVAQLFSRRANQRDTIGYFNHELLNQAGFTMRCYQVPSMTEGELQDAIGQI